MRIRLNQEYRNKIANRMRVHLEQENTQEKEKDVFLKFTLQYSCNIVCVFSSLIQSKWPYVNNTNHS